MLRFGIFLLVVAIVFSSLAYPCSFRNIDCGQNGKCLNEFNDYSCSCGEGSLKMNDTIPQSTCITNYCYGVDCGRGDCENSLNDFNCLCEPGLRFIDSIDYMLKYALYMWSRNRRSRCLRPVTILSICWVSVITTSA